MLTPIIWTYAAPHLAFSNLKDLQMNTGTTLSGLRLLLVEDESLIAMLIHDIVSDAGAHVVGSAANIAAAISVLESEPIDGAILDVNLGGERVDSVADELHARNIPFLFLTGYGRSSIAERFRPRP